MRSSISSSETFRGSRFPLLAVAAAVAALLLYASAVQVWTPKSAVLRGQNQGETNRIAAETLVDSAVAPGTIIVGSSLAQRIPAEALGPGVSNMALIGEGLVTGLDIVDRSGLVPKLVLIESNVLERAANEQLIDPLFEFPVRQLRPTLKVLQRSRRPANLMVNLLRGGRGDTDYGAPPPDVLRTLLRDHQASLQPPFEPGLLDRRVAEVVKRVDDIRSRGIAVAFFEMPVDPSLVDLPRPAAIRAALQARFPPPAYCWITIALPAPLQTRDGLHLTQPFAKLAGEQLMAKASTCASAGAPTRPSAASCRSTCP
jgi:hypothetical protein